MTLQVRRQISLLRRKHEFKVEIEDAQGNVTLDNSTISACYLEMGTGNFAADDLCVALFTGH